MTDPRLLGTLINIDTELQKIARNLGRIANVMESGQPSPAPGVSTHTPTKEDVHDEQGARSM